MAHFLRHPGAVFLGRPMLYFYFTKHTHTFGYQHISMDSIVAGIEKVFPETGINSDADVDALVNVRQISRKLAPFIQAMIESGEYDECDYGMVIDVYQLLPEDFVRFIDPAK